MGTTSNLKRKIRVYREKRNTIPVKIRLQFQYVLFKKKKKNSFIVIKANTSFSMKFVNKQQG